MLPNISERFSAQQIDARIAEMANQINKDYAGKEIVIVGLMKGCLFLLTDFVRKLNLDLSIEIVYAVSYHGSKSTGNVEILLDLRSDIFNKDVLVVDDIVDTGLTLNKIKNMLMAKEPKSLEFLTLLDKKECRLSPIDVKYIGFTIKNEFFVGYGMDYDEKLRQLPFLGIMKQ